MVDKLDDFPSLSKEDLEIKKLKLEIALLLENSREPKNVSFLTKATKFLQNNIGQLATIFALIAAVTTPVINYIADTKKAQLIAVNESILDLAGNDSALNSTKLLKVATQDPNIITPFLLLNLNEHSSYSIDTGKIRSIYTVMYKLNKDWGERSLFEDVVFFFVNDNKSVIEKKLFSNFTYQFEHPDTSNKYKLMAVWKTYVNIIFDCHLENDKRFMVELKRIKALANGTPGNNYNIILNIIDNKK
jgi:hypothetical protein